MQIEDLRRALGRYADGKKLARLEELLFMQDDIRRARKQFSTEEKELEEQVQVEL
jgi:transcription initiation factor TFIID subunit 13